MLAMALRGADPDTGKGFQTFPDIATAERDARSRSHARNPEMLRKFPFTMEGDRQ